MAVLRAAAAPVAALGLALLLGEVSACSSPEIVSEDTPKRACGFRVWHRPASRDAYVEIVGDWNGWRRPGVVPVEQEGGFRVAVVDVPPGEHAYAIVEDGVWLADKNVPMVRNEQGREVSVAVAENCDQPLLRVDGVTTTSEGRADIHATFVSARDGAKMDPASLTATARGGARLLVASADPARGTVTFEATGLARGKYTYTLEGRDALGRSAEDARAVAWIDATSGTSEPWEPRDAVIYQVVLDRYRGADGPLAPPVSPSARAGGSLSGVRAALESGEIEALGANAIWLSPLYANPAGEFPGNDGRLYTSYHGYWPIASRALDPRFATEGELDAFVHAAHARGTRVYFDVVPNHVHEEHPWVKEHPNWFGDGCICGQGACDWASHIETCRFASYLPDLDWSNLDAARASASDVLWWLERWDGDGLRVDAVPMMPRSAVRRITTSVRRRFAHPGHAPYVIGENFTGPGNFQSLRYDLGPHGLDGSFHFPLMWAIRSAIARESAPMSSIGDAMLAGEEAWAGSGAVMGLMIGNHDVSRFASVSAGSDDGDPWGAAPQPLDPMVYAKQAAALTTVLTLPGAPVLYYGDEIGLAGKGDPDCRRVMPPEEELLASQVRTRELVRRVGRVRACSRALRRGAFEVLAEDDERLVFVRALPASSPRDGDDIAVVAIVRRPTRPLEVTLPLSAARALIDVVRGEPIDATSGAVTVDNAPFGVHVWIPAESACASVASEP